MDGSETTLKDAIEFIESEIYGCEIQAEHAPNRSKVQQRFKDRLVKLKNVLAQLKGIQ